MADRIKVNTANLNQWASRLSSASDELTGAAGILNNADANDPWIRTLRISGSIPLRFEGSNLSFSSVSGAISRISSVLNRYSQSVGALAVNVRKISDDFSRVESDLKALFDGAAETEENDVNSGSGTAGAVDKGVWDWLNYEIADDHPGITAWIGKASSKVANDYASAEITAHLGKVEAKLDGDATFFQKKKEKEYKDGKWEETESYEVVNLEVEMGVNASLADVDAKGTVGNDLLGAEAGAGGSIGNAALEGKAGVTVSNDKIEVIASGKAMVSAVEGEASGTINILGIEITGSVGGYAGAVGVEGKIGFENGKFVMKGGAAALIGGSAGIEIGINDAGWEAVCDFVDFVISWD